LVLGVTLQELLAYSLPYFGYHSLFIKWFDRAVLEAIHPRREGMCVPVFVALFSLIVLASDLFLIQSGRRCVLIAVIIMVILFMLPGGGPSVDDNIRSGQAQHDSTVHEKPSNNNYADNTDDNMDVTDIEAEMDVVREDLEQAQQQELAKTKSALSAAIDVTSSYVKSAFSKLLAKTDISEEEIQQMVAEVESKLEQETIEKLEEDAEEMVETYEDNIEQEAFDESDSGVAVDEIRIDIEANEETAIREMNQQLEKEAEAMKKMMRKKAEEFEIEILEKRLEEKLHKKIKLVVLDDEIADVEHMLDGLSVLKGERDPTSSSYGKAPVDSPPDDDGVAGSDDTVGGEPPSNDDDNTSTNDDDAN
jgi:hypothetical protein